MCTDLTTAGVNVSQIPSSVEEGTTIRVKLETGRYNVHVSAVSGTAMIGECTYYVQIYILVECYAFWASGRGKASYNVRLCRDVCLLLQTGLLPKCHK